MPTYIRRAASVYDADAADLTGASIVTGTDPVSDTGLTNDTEYVVQELSPIQRFTPAGVPAFTENLITFNGSKEQWWDGGGDLHTTDTRNTMLFFSFVFPSDGTAHKVIQSNGLRVNLQAGGEINVTITDSVGDWNTVTGTANLAGGQFVAGTRTAIAVQTTADGTDTRVRSAFKVGANAWDVGASNLDLTRARDSLDLTSTWALFSLNTPGSYNAANWDTGLYGVAFYADVTGNILTDSALLDAFVNADGTLKAPSELNTYLGATPAIDTRGNTVEDMNNLVNQGSLTIAGRGVAWS